MTNRAPAKNRANVAWACFLVIGLTYFFGYSTSSCAEANFRTSERCFIQNFLEDQLQNRRVNHPEIQREKHQHCCIVCAARVGSDLSGKSSPVGLGGQLWETFRAGIWR